MNGNLVKFLAERTLAGIVVLYVVASLTFLVMKAVPGGPFDREKNLPPAIKKNIEAKYGLDLPWHRQYLRYMKGIALLDLGPSYKYRSRTVGDILSETFPVSMKLGLWAFLLAVVLGVSAGTLAGLTPQSSYDKISMLSATVGISVPNFVLAGILLFVLAFKLRLFPSGLWEAPESVVLPALSLGLAPSAYIARLTRSSVLEVVHQPHVVTAKAKGAPGWLIVFKHILRSALTPVVTILGPLLAGLVTGSFVVEYMFALPGMGRYFVTAVTDRDYPLIMGVTLTYSALIVVANIIVDLLYTILDPRVKMG